jgi:multidrug resistance efflux pump
MSGMTDPRPQGPAVRTQPDAGSPLAANAAAGNVRIAPPSTHVPRELLTLLQLGRRARSAESVAALGFILVNESHQLFAYRQAAFWLNGHIAAVSGVPQVESNVPYVQWLGEVCKALGNAGGPVRTVTAADVPEALAERWAEWLPTYAVWMPLVHAEKQQGAVLLATEEPLNERALALASEVAGIYAHALAAFQPRQTARERLRAALRPTRQRLLVAAAAVAVALLPVRQSVLATAEVVPSDPFLVRAPLDGVIDRFLVQPNQRVSAGTPLFAMDVTALQTRNDLARNAYETAQEEYRQSAQAAVTDDKSKLDVALRRGELAARAAELDYAASQLGRVQVKAERDGLAVFADVNDFQGKAVMLGERILTLANPSEVALAIDFPAREQLDLQVGTAVTLYPSDAPLLSYEARVTQIAYHAEVARDGVLAYRLKATFINGAEVPRIGLMGTAKLTGGRVPLLYYALRRPLTAVRQWLGW